jgi:excinuclease ABC subunit B
MRKTIDETNRRRAKQKAYNEAHGLKPQALKKSRESILAGSSAARSPHTPQPEAPDAVAAEEQVAYQSAAELKKAIQATRKKMENAAKALDFIEAAGGAAGKPHRFH